MESIALTIKFVVMYACEVFVIAVIGAVLIAGLVQIVTDKILVSRRLDEVVPEARPTAL